MFLYLIITFFATMIGVISGLGGGSIMKPLFDIIGEYSAKEMSIMTSLTTFSMSLVSVVIEIIRQCKISSKAKAVAVENLDQNSIKVENNDTLNSNEKWILLMIIVGTIFGGILGSYIFSILTQGAVDSIVKIVQNTILILMIVFILIYMRKDKVFSFNSTNKYLAIIVGLVLGMISAFLGIGGGPLNVAIVVLVFGFTVKQAATYSMFIILFAQMTKLITSIISGGFGIFSIDIIYYVVISGVIGALIGKLLAIKATGKAIKIVYKCAQILILIMCAYNIIKYSLYL